VRSRAAVAQSPNSAHAGEIPAPSNFTVSLIGDTSSDGADICVAAGYFF
jgi:hypothetical protein